jgi:hypothetical protein
MRNLLRALVIVGILLGAILIGSNEARANRWHYRHRRFPAGPVYGRVYRPGIYGVPYGRAYARPYMGLRAPGGFVTWGNGLGSGYVGWGAGRIGPRYPGWGGYGYGYPGFPMSSGYYATSYGFPF